MSNASRRRLDARHGGLVALALVIVLLPALLTNDYFYEVAILVAMNAIVCVGLNLLIGYAGQISLGHAGFFALGAYGTAILASRYDWPVWLSIPTSIAAVGLLALLIGRPTLRLKGHYLAMATLGLGVIVSIVLLRMQMKRYKEKRSLSTLVAGDGIVAPAVTATPH